MNRLRHHELLKTHPIMQATVSTNSPRDHSGPLLVLVKTVPLATD